MKKTILVLCAALVMTLAGCSGGSNTGGTSDQNNSGAGSGNNNNPPANASTNNNPNLNSSGSR